MFIPTYKSEKTVTSKEFGKVNYNMEWNAMQSLKRCYRIMCNEMKKILTFFSANVF